MSAANFADLRYTSPRTKPTPAALLTSADRAAANGVRAEAAPAPTLSSVPSKEECVICRESYSSSQARKLECGHQFHELVRIRCPPPPHTHTQTHSPPGHAELAGGAFFTELCIVRLVLTCNVIAKFFV